MDGTSPTSGEILASILYAHGTSPYNADRRAYCLLDERGQERQSLTWRELHERANHLALQIRACIAPGERALVMFPAGLDFVIAFLACLYAEVVSVPVNPPRRNQKLGRMIDILEDSQCRLALTTPEIRSLCEAEGGDLARRLDHWLTTIEEPGLKGLLTAPPSGNPDRLALLQYTSGSTGSPKGVMVSDGNLTWNLELSRQAFDVSSSSVIVSWLPMFHDMGLIGIVLQVVYSGALGIIMPPAGFLRRPAVWLRTISTYRATHTCSPNFGFEHATRQIKDSEMEGIDLSSLRAACCGAEPIRKAAIDGFQARFAAYGLAPTVIMPSYGMAETTLAVTVTPRDRGPRYHLHEEEGTAAERGRPVAGCGGAGLGMEVLVVTPESRRPCPDGTVGEIWVAGSSVTQGYWNRPEKTEETFHARLDGDNARGPYLRTGDLGFLQDGELFVTGRLSDLIIIRGRNIYPQDIEAMVEDAHPAFNHGGAAAFSIEEDGQERLIVLQELRRATLDGEDKAALIASIQRMLSSEMDLIARDVVLLKPGRVPRTSSGKTARRVARAAYLDGKLDGVIAVAGAEATSQPAAVPRAVAATPAAVSATEPAIPVTDEIVAWLRARAARLLNQHDADIDPTRPLSDFGLDSVGAAEIALDLEDRYGVDVPPTVLYDHPGINGLAAYIHGRLKRTAPPATDSPPATVKPPPAAKAAASPRPARTTRTSRASVSVQAGSDMPRQPSVEADDIAIIGMAARMPGSDSVEAFWRDLLAGQDRVGSIPESRWPGVSAETSAGAYPDAAGLISDVAGFDPQFFAISPREAEHMDPQQRLFLEQAWTALEDAGLSDQMLAGQSCGVFVGCSDGDYRDVLDAAGAPPSAYALMGNANSILAARIAYFLDLKGPCLTIDTACSSSLVAVHQACESLRSGECTLALAGGVSVLATPRFHRLAAKAGMLAPGGRCRAFASDAEGFVPAEGVGVIVLKPLSAARRDKDHIHAVIKGTGVNQDGRTNGITAPNGPSQTALESAVHDRFGIDPRHIGYVEAHGTGTRLGDPIEVGALTATFRRRTADTGFCAIGSVKTNIGHTLAAAGVAGLIKAALTVREGRIPPSLHCTQTNALLKLEDSPFRLVPEACDWLDGGNRPRLAAVNSFGFSGTNAHVVLAAPPSAAASADSDLSDPGPLLLVLSAKTPAALQRRAADLRDWLDGPGHAWSLPQVAGALARRRSHFSQRLALVVNSRDDALDQLARWQPETTAEAKLLEPADLDATLNALAAVPDRASALHLLARHYTAGGILPWDRVMDANGPWPPLPPYRFDREPCWIAPTSASPVAPVIEHIPSPAAISAADLRAAVERELVGAVSSILKLRPEQVHLSTDIRDFGFDSINVVSLTDSLNNRYGTKVTPPELFEHKTLESLLEGLLEDHGAIIAEAYARETTPSGEPVSQMPEDTPVTAPSMEKLAATAPIARSGRDDVASDPIAIVGMAGTLPGAVRLADFWARLKAGDDLMSEVPGDRWDWREGYGDPMAAPGQTKVRWGGFLDAVDRFDAGFFGLSHREANLMDPQQRLFLQCAWHAIEDAGIRPADLAGSRTGVFVGIFTADYSELLINSGYIREAHAITGLAHSILPNRLSYLLDLHGPSIPVDTACSSSLVALHQAVESIRSGSCDMALVGGVNLMLSQTQFMSASRAGMICEDGRCKSFDKRANGYARGEGVGAIFIKPLSRALADGNPIHAVIRGTAVNHGGAANSLTSPNPEAQADVIVRAMERAGVRPDRVTYLEAHGTGTALGDPIEINGLKKAYGRLYASAGLEPQPGACAIGTVKTAIGHLEAAAGIAGILKVILALRDRHLHGNIHLKDVNPYIDLTGSPFRLLQDGEPWKAQLDEEGDPLPRLAGISSFGFGGANAHVVLEEWPRKDGPAAPAIMDRPHLFPLSARAPERLADLARELALHLRRQEPAPTLVDVAFTLQQGRTAWPHRVALCCATLPDLITALDSVAAGNTADMAVGTVTPATQTADAATKVDAAVKTGDLRLLGQLWCQGAEIPWRTLYPAGMPRLLPLPGYPFAATRHWIPDVALTADKPRRAAALIAPTPVVTEPVPVSRPGGATLPEAAAAPPAQLPLTGLRSDAVYFTHHIVAGQPILPGAHSMELLRDGASRALGGPVTTLGAVRWLAPVTQRHAQAGLTLSVDPVPNQPDEVALTLRSTRGPDRVVIHCEARATRRSGSDPAPATLLDRAQIQARCPHRTDRTSLYSRLKAAGLAYGAAFQPVEQVWASDVEAFGELSLPDAARADMAGTVLSPSLLDGAFQCLAGIVAARADAGQGVLLVPHRVGAVDILAPLRDRVLVHARLRGPVENNRRWGFDLDIADRKGRVLIRLRDMELREMNLGSGAKPAPAPMPLPSTPVPVHTWTTTWVERTAPVPASTSPSGLRMLILTGRTDGVIPDLPGVQVIRVTPHDQFQKLGPDFYGLRPDAATDYEALLADIDPHQLPEHMLVDNWFTDSSAEDGVVRLFHLVKAMVQHRGRLSGRITVVTDNPDPDNYAPTSAALAGLLKSAVAENSKLRIRLVEVAAGQPAGDALLAEVFDADDTVTEVRLTPGRRLVRRTVSLTPATATPPVLKAAGVYWITGGAGGIGRVLAMHLARSQGARLALSGRRTESADIRALLADIAKAGGEALYVCADMGDPASLAAALATIETRFGPVDGVFHGAGLLRDARIAVKSEADLRAVLAPKIQGLQTLDHVLGARPLDFLVAFSSVTGVAGNMGQCDYAAANAFMDAFMARRQEQVTRGVRHGRSITINWPLWAEGGMTVPDAIRPMITSMTGMTLLDNAPAMAALELALAAGTVQVIPATGDRVRIAAYLKEAPAATAPEPLPPASAMAAAVAAPAAVSAVATVIPDNTEELRRRTIAYLIDTFSAAVGMAASDVEAETPFQNLGVDSFIILQLLSDLEGQFGPLPKTLLFENHCVADLAGYFMTEHEETLRLKLGLPANVPPPAPVAAAAVASPVPVVPAPSPGAPLLLAERDLDNAEPVAAGAIAGIVAAHGGESTAMGRGNFAPLIFLGASRRGLFYCNRKADLFVTFGYLGPDDALEETLQDVEAWCRDQGLQLLLVESGAVLDRRSTLYSATPFAVLQRVDDLPGFTLDGKAMRRLRYQVSRFESAGAATTREYTIGSDAATDAAIIDVIGRWAAAKVMVNPYVERLLANIRAGRLPAAYRTFLTEQGGVLWNAIIISAMPSHGGYLMDCEFYPDDMPQGGLEFTIINIIDQLRREGCRMFSLGVTWGAQVESRGEPQPASARVLTELAEKGIFDGSGNLQFKNKFRPDNSQIYLFQKKGETRERVLDVILMIANSKGPDTPQTSAAATDPTPAPVAVVRPSPASLSPSDPDTQLETAGRNPANIPAAAVDIDLATDSWAKLDRPWLVEAPGGAMGPGPVRALLRDLFPLPHMVLTRSGDEAERCLWAALQRPGKVVLQTPMFPTFIFNAVNNGYSPEEIARTGPDGAPGPLIDLARLESRLNAGTDTVAAVCLELLDNAAGGWPVPLEHLEAVKALTASRNIPLVIDATRVLDNALAGLSSETTEAVWTRAQRLCAVADIVTASLSKNLMVRQGGLVAANDASLIDRVRTRAEAEGLVLPADRVAALGAALSDPDRLVAAVAQRREHVARLADALRAAGIPLATAPVESGARQGGHAVLVHVTAMPAFSAQAHPLASFLDYLYRRTGIRGGLHSTGIKRNAPLDGMVRLAVPVGMPGSVMAEMERRIACLSPAPADLEPLILVSRDKGFAADVTARYKASPGDGGGSGSATSSNADGKVEASGQPPVTPRRAPAPRAIPPDSTRDDVAIIGMAGRYPQADRLDDFWANLLAGKDCIERRPLARFGEVLPRSHAGIPAERWGGFINNIDTFDSLFFGISPREAAALDPQERLFMEIAWETLEDAGYSPEGLAQQDPSRKIGVYVGAVWQLYQILGSEQTRIGNLQTGNSLLWSIANRVSAFMNFTGPSMAVDTACSGSLAAIQLACQAIQSGACSAALVGGVNFDLHASKWLLTEAGGFLSPDGRCKAFGKGANGYVAGEGIGAVLLKPLSLAQADGDNILGIIKACTINHGGQASGYSVPNPKAQADLVAEAMASAGIDARTVGYIEAHGTGTQLGDPIEVQGLTSAFRRFTDETGFCALGSVKSNIGHLEAAAGIAGLTKVLLQMRHRTLVPSLFCEQTNELIPFADTPFRVQTRVEPWMPMVVDGRAHPLRAGISSFGAGGTNVHLIVEEPPPRVDRAAGPADASVVPQGGMIFPLSARTEEQLREAALRLAAYLAAHPSADLDDVAFSLCRRQSMRFRLAVVARNADALRTALTAHATGQGKADGLFVGTAKDSKALQKMLSIEEIEGLARSRLASGRAEGLAQAWVQGLMANLDAVAFPATARRISLPTYPFERARHWFKIADNAALEVPAPASTATGSGAPARLHPLLDRCQPVFDGVLFRKAINPGEYVFTDHIVAGRPTLPGVAYIEMACAAHAQVFGMPPARLRNLVWAAPITGDMTSEISVRLERVEGTKGEELTACAVTTQMPGQPEMLHARTRMVSILDTAIPPARLDLAAIRRRFTRHTSRERCYEMLSHLQFRYGDCLSAIQGVDHDDTEGLTRLVLPERLHADFGAYQLHPSLMDGAVQSIISVVQDEASGTGSYQPYVPFVVGEVDIFHPLTPVCFAYIRLKRGTRDAPDIKKVDVTLVDETGRVLVEMRDFALKAFSLEELSAVVGGDAQIPAAPTPYSTTEPITAAQTEDICLRVDWE